MYQCRGEEKSDLDEILEAMGMDPFPSLKTVEVKGDPLMAPHFPPFSGSTPNATGMIEKRVIGCVVPKQ